PGPGPGAARAGTPLPRRSAARWHSACRPGTRRDGAPACRDTARATAPSRTSRQTPPERPPPPTPGPSRTPPRPPSPGSAAPPSPPSPGGRPPPASSPVQLELHHDRVLAGAVVAAPDAEIVEAEPAVEAPRHQVAGPYLEKHGTRARRAAFLDHRFHQRAADAAATSRLVHRDVEQVHLVRDAPAAAVPDEHRTRVRLLDGY